MDDAGKRAEVGIGETPRAAVRDLVPSTEKPGVEWIEGIYGFSDRADPAEDEDEISREVTIIYECETMQHRIRVVRTETEWRARFTGGKKLPW